MALEPRTKALVSRGRFTSSVIIVTMAGHLPWAGSLRCGGHQPNLQIRKPKLREGQTPTQSHTVGLKWGWDSCPGLSPPRLRGQ